jgi:hypothetical protein
VLGAEALHQRARRHAGLAGHVGQREGRPAPADCGAGGRDEALVGDGPGTCHGGY